MSTFEDEMREFDKEWEGIETGGRRGLLPDGFHGLKGGQIVGTGPVWIDEARVESNDRGFSFHIKYVNDSGQVQGWFGLDNEIGRQISKEQIVELGYDGPLSGLEKACESGMFNDLKCGIFVKTKSGTERDYTTPYIREVYGKDPNRIRDAVPAGGVPEDGTVVDSDDDIPF